MNKLFLALAISVIGTTAFAQESNSGAIAGSGSNSTSVSGAGAQATGGYAESGTSRANSSSGAVANTQSGASSNATGIGSNLQGQGQRQNASADNTNVNGQSQGMKQGQSANNTQGQSANNDQGQSQGQIQGQDQGNEQNMYNINVVPEVQTIRTHVSGTQTIKNVPSVYAPALASSNDTCMGSSSFGASGVGFGLTIGTTWTDANCIMLKNSRELYNMGMQDASFARLCMDPLNREAIELAGRVCPQTKKEEAAKAAAVAQAQ